MAIVIDELPDVMLVAIKPGWDGFGAAFPMGHGGVRSFFDLRFLAGAGDRNQGPADPGQALDNRPPGYPQHPGHLGLIQPVYEVVNHDGPAAVVQVFHQPPDSLARENLVLLARYPRHEGDRQAVEICHRLSKELHVCRRGYTLGGVGRGGTGRASQFLFFLLRAASRTSFLSR